MNTIKENIFGESMADNAESKALIDHLLHLADDALILGHRNSEWCGHGPVLELDIAITNIALDLVGQARNFYQYAAEIINGIEVAGVGSRHGVTTEDNLAYHRNTAEFKNSLLVEQPNGDWGVTIMRQFFFSVYQYYLYEKLQYSKDERIAAIAAKALKEVTYHVRWSSEWVIRLGTGTGESHDRMCKAVAGLNGYTNELFIPATYETESAAVGYGIDITTLKSLWLKKVTEIFAEASLDEEPPVSMHNTLLFGKEGQHTKHLETILADMQYLQRTHPGAHW